MAYSYKGSISFGLVYIPIKLETCIKENDISFNQLEKNTKSRIRYQKTCDECDGKAVEQKDIVKGYQYEDGKYVIFNDEDFEKIKSKKDKSITIEQFVDLNEIDPIYFQKAYFVIPIGAEKAFALFKESLERENKVGIAKTVIGSKETVVALRVRNGEMLLNTLYFYDEVKKNPVKEIASELIKQELDMAAMIIKNMSATFKPASYKDEYTEKVLKAIEAKISGKEISSPKEVGGKIIDLMDALKASLEQTSKASPAKTLAKVPTANAPNKTITASPKQKPKTKTATNKNAIIAKSK